MRVNWKFVKTLLDCKSTKKTNISNKHNTKTIFIWFLVFLLIVFIPTLSLAYYMISYSYPFVKIPSRQLSTASNTKIIINSNDTLKEPDINSNVSSIFDFLNLPFYHLSNASETDIIHSKQRKATFVEKLYPMTRICSPELPNLESNDFSICWCNVCTAGLGNVFSQFFAIRAMAYFLDMDFHAYHSSKMEDCNQKHQYHLLFPEKDYHYSLMSYLPKHSSKHINNDWNLTSNSKSKLQIFLKWMNECSSSRQSLKLLRMGNHFTYRTCMVSFYYNPIFIPIFREESLMAVHEYMNDRNIRFDIKSEIYPNIAIHIRAGDIVLGRNPEYGLLLMSFYKKAILEISRLHFGLNIKHFKQILIITQLAKNTLKFFMSKTQNESQILIDAYLKAFAAEILPFMAEDIDIKVIGDGHRTIDIYRMSQSSLLICSLSTFCWYAAKMSVNPVIMPHGGPWEHLGKDLMNGVMWKPSNHFYLNSKNLCLMGHEKKKKHLNTVEQIVQYVVEH